MTDALRSLLAPALAEIEAYRTGSTDPVMHLDANEAAPFLSEAAQATLARAAADTNWRRYPSITSDPLRRAIAERMAVSAEEITLGVGSDEIITLLLTALSQPRGQAPAATLVTTSPTFVMYRASAKVRGQRVLEVPLDAEWDLDIAGLKRAVDFSAPNLIFIASPNNPTSRLADPSRLEALIQHARESLVVIDEAYIDYSERDQLDLYRRFENVAIMRTLSKVGFAALRVGWLVARPWLINELEKVRLPYNLPSASQRLATLALTALWGEVSKACRETVAQRTELTETLRAIDGVTVTPSDANFLWIRTEKPAEAVFGSLKAQGILVRSFHTAGGRLASQLRITIGSEQENAALAAAMKSAVTG